MLRLQFCQLRVHLRQRRFQRGLILGKLRPLRLQLLLLRRPCRLLCLQLGESLRILLLTAFILLLSSLVLCKPGFVLLPAGSELRLCICKLLFAGRNLLHRRFILFIKGSFLRSKLLFSAFKLRPSVGNLCLCIRKLLFLFRKRHLAV